MSTWQSMTALIAGIPDLPGAQCKGRADLFEVTVGDHNRPASRAEIQHARATALRLCETCPALNRCQVWFDGLRISQRPRGVVAGQVIAAGGLPMRTRTQASRHEAER